MTFLKQLRNGIFSSPVYTFSFVFLSLLIVVSVLAPLIPLDPRATNVTQLTKPPSLEHWFGTDEVGRDYFIRVIYGGRVSLIVGVLAMVTATFIGTVIGLVSGYFGGWIDTVLMRSVDVLSSIPWMVLVIVLSAFLRPGMSTIILVIGGFSWMSIARMIRGETLAAKERDFVIYGQFIGERPAKIILRHIVPMVLPTLIVAATTSISTAIMTEAALSFLGMGIQQPMTSWGTLLQNAQSLLQRAPFMAIAPGLFVGLTIYSFNNLGDLLQATLLKER